MCRASETLTVKKLKRNSQIIGHLFETREGKLSFHMSNNHVMANATVGNCNNTVGKFKNDETKVSASLVILSKIAPQWQAEINYFFH
jgi:hypothetical protein